MFFTVHSWVLPIPFHQHLFSSNRSKYVHIVSSLCKDYVFCHYCLIFFLICNQPKIQSLYIFLRLGPISNPKGFFFNRQRYFLCYFENSNPYMINLKINIVSKPILNIKGIKSENVALKLKVSICLSKKVSFIFPALALSFVLTSKETIVKRNICSQSE